MESSAKLESLKVSIIKMLPPAILFPLRSIKRALNGEPPLSWTRDKFHPMQSPRYVRNQPAPATREPNQDGQSVRLPAKDGRPIQDHALGALRANHIHAPWVYYGYDDILLLPSQEIAKTLTLSVQYINGAHVIGDIAEFGTMSGFSARTIAMAMVFDLQRQPLSKSAGGENPFRILRLFDSFIGLPEITDPVDMNAPHVVSGAWAQGGCKVLAASELAPSIATIIPPHRFQIYEGWFADTVKTLPPETRFAMIHFDGDLYSSTMDALVPLFERGMISTGCMLCFDDWSANRAIPTTGERQAWKDLTKRFNIEFSSCGDYASAGTRFIIHSYDGIPADPI